MTLPAEPPRYKSFRDLVAPLKQGTTGWAAYAMQKVVGVEADGVWGPITDQAVRAWQKQHKLAADGIAGPVTQQFILNDYGAKADEAHHLPIGVGYGFAFSEGGAVLAATNWDNPGAVDCGPAQWRIKGPPFSMVELKDAFDPRRALDHACEVLATRRVQFAARNPALKARPSVTLRVAVLAHNAPYGGMADHIVETYDGVNSWWRYVTRPDDPATWIKKEVDGEVVYPFTRSQWAREYPRRILKFVA